MNKDNKMIAGIVGLNIFLMILRIYVGDGADFTGNAVTGIIFLALLGLLTYFLVLNKNDEFILTYLSFYFASPIILVPFISIGSLGLINAVIIPLMLYKSFKPTNRYYLIILAVLIFSIFNLADVSARLILSRLFHFSSLLLLFYFALTKLKKPEKILKIAALIALINLPLALYEVAFRPDWAAFTDWRGDRIPGNLFHPNSYATFLLPAIIFLYYQLRLKPTPLRFIAFGGLCLASIFSFSRIGLIATAVSVLIFEALYKEGIRPSAKKAFLLVILLFGGFAITLLDISDPHLQSDTINERTGIWESVAPYLQQSPIFGNGIGSYELARPDIVNSLSPHNVYLEIMFEMGLFGLALILFFWLMIYKSLFSKLSKTKAGMAEIGIAIITGILIIAFTDGSAFSQVVSSNGWIMVACTLAVGGKSK